MARILFVEDEPVAIEMLELMSAQYIPMYHRKTKIVSSAAEAMKILAIRPFDYVVLDFYLADGGTAFDIIQFINEQPQHKLSIIMLTANDEKGTLQRACELGVAHYILKPINIPVIGKAIQKIIAGLESQDDMNVMLDSSKPIFRDFKNDLLYSM